MSSLHMAAAAHDNTMSVDDKAPENPSEKSLDQPVTSEQHDHPEPASNGALTAVNGAQSQPMTATPSSSTPQPDNTDQPVSNASTPPPASLSYGTRSRNRGAPRPNYAEDHELDADLEPASNSSKAQASRRASSQNQSTSQNRVGAVSPENEKSTGVSTRRAQTATNNNSNKDGIPGTTMFSANPSSGNVSKKRKQPGSGQMTQGTTTPNGVGSSKEYVSSASQSDESRVSNMMTFNNSGGHLKNGKLKADDGTVLAPNDHVYLICEPPGEPYYLGRIMEFLPAKSDPNGPVDSIRVNWFYRPRDIQRKSGDVRVVFASMHSDTCPLASLRGKCRIFHRSEIDDLEEYKKTRDSFWFEKMYDRYIQRYYEVVPTNKVINVPEHVKKVLDERWKYVLVEMGRRAELTSQVKTCKRCGRYAANSDSVDCAVCNCTYHMHCVRPVLLKKPARGFAWACAACSRAQEKKMEARDTPILGESQAEPEPEALEEDEEDVPVSAEPADRTNPTNSEQVRPATSEQIAQAKLWPFRYLGVHCRVEDALDYDDRIYPRASSRLGTRHQANVNPWYGHPVRYVKARETKKRAPKGAAKKDMKLSKEATAAIEAEKAERANRPKWVMDEPTGYIRRGEDEPVPVAGKEVHTAQTQFKMPDASQLPARGEDDSPGSHLGDAEREKFVDDYMKEAKKVATSKGIEQYSTNFLDKALHLLYEENYSSESALARLKQIHKYKDLKEPHLRPDEVKAFESGIAKYGSELRSVTKHVKTVPHRHIVRHYYMWKKTPQGRRIWGNFEGRKTKQAAKKPDTTAKLMDDVADDHDDSAFDNDKAEARKRGFVCKFCSCRSSRQWRRAPGAAPGTTQSGETGSKRDKLAGSVTVALCQRCAVLWRKYGIHWEDADEVAKRIVQVGSKSWRRRYEEQLLAQLLTSSESDVKINSTTAATAVSLDLPVTADMTKESSHEPPPKKKSKLSDKDGDGTATPAESAPKKKAADKPTEPPPLNPEPPRVKMLPCAVCKKMEPTGDQHLACRDCRLTVHRACYGVPDSQNSSKWFCDMCSNDKNPVISTSYECVLCPVTWTEHELMEPPKNTHKKKSEREKEREKLEKDMVQEAIKLYRQRQEDVGKPIGPREALKRTDGNNWVHVTCAVWIPEVKFGNSKELEPAENLAMIPFERFKETCKICNSSKGACIPCHNATCNARFHASCAHQAGYTMGFDVTPVKSSRRDSISMIKLGEEVGAATPVAMCPNHPVSNIVHAMSDATEVDKLNALQLYVQRYKQADLTLTGTVRKAAHVQQSSAQGGLTVGSRRGLSNGPASQKENSQVTGKGTAPSTKDAADGQVADAQTDGASPQKTETKTCHACQTSFSPKWWKYEPTPYPNSIANTFGREGRGFGDPAAYPRTPLYECHKCHAKRKAQEPPPSDIRPAPYAGHPDAGGVPTSRGSEFPPHSLGPLSHAHPIQPPNLPARGSLGRPPPHGTPEWRPEYEQQRPNEFANHLGRNAPPTPQGTNAIPLHPSGYQNSPPSHVNGYHTAVPPHHQGPPPPPPPPPRGPAAPAAYSNGIPPPPPPPPSHHPYQAHQSPYGPIGMTSSAPPPASTTQTYTSSASPPAPQFSPPASRSALSHPAPCRILPAERTCALHVSPVSRRSVDPQVPSTAMDQKTAPSPGENGRPESSGRNSGHQNSGASASPSLKNLLL